MQTIHTQGRGRRNGAGGPAATEKEGPMTDRRDGRDRESREWRASEEPDERQREERERRSDELKESWRRNHPSEEEDGKGRPGRGRPS